MYTATPNPFKMGKKQKRIVLEMCQNGCKIVRFDNLSNGKIDCTLSDDDGNDFEDLSVEWVEKLANRFLFKCVKWHPQMDVIIYEYRMKPELVEETILILT